MKHVDVVVIGTGPAGQRAAIQAAKLGRQVTLVERNNVLGGACTNTGTIPSKAVREAVLHLTGIGQRRFYGHGLSVKSDVSMADLTYRCQHIIRTEREVIHGHLTRNGVELTWGEARFVDPDTIEIVRPHGSEVLRAEHVVIATGTAPTRPPNIPFDRERIVDSDGLLRLPRLPKCMIIVGGGVIGTEYACMMAALGVRVILVEARD